MKDFFSNVSPRRAVLDLWRILGAPSEYRARSLALAALVTGTIFYGLTGEEDRGLPRPPELIYITSLAANRSDAEIVAENAKAQAAADKAQAEDDARADDVRRIYRAVGAATGIETQSMYDQGSRDRENERKAAKARALDILRKYTHEANPVTAPPPALAPAGTPPGPNPADAAKH